MGDIVDSTTSPIIISGGLSKRQSRHCLGPRLTELLCLSSASNKLIPLESVNLAPATCPYSYILKPNDLFVCLFVCPN